MSQASRVSPIETNATICPIVVMGMGAEVRLREGKLSPTGRQTYMSGTILLVEGKDGTISANKSASVHVLDIPARAGTYELGTQYKAEGSVWVMPFEKDGRVALSITVEKLSPVAVLANPMKAAG